MVGAIPGMLSLDFIDRYFENHRPHYPLGQYVFLFKGTHSIVYLDKTESYFMTFLRYGVIAACFIIVTSFLVVAITRPRGR